MSQEKIATWSTCPSLSNTGYQMLNTNSISLFLEADGQAGTYSLIDARLPLLCKIVRVEVKEEGAPNHFFGTFPIPMGSGIVDGEDGAILFDECRFIREDVQELMTCIAFIRCGVSSFMWGHC